VVSKKSQIDRAVEKLEQQIAVKRAEIEIWERAIHVIRSEAGKIVQAASTRKRKAKPVSGEEGIV
jgi:hypothetical protein